MWKRIIIRTHDLPSQSIIKGKGVSKKEIKGYINLIRPHNAAIGGFSVFIGAFLTGSLEPVYPLIAACVSGLLLTAAANTINDYYDVDSDRINKPKRPIPAGKVTRSSARKIAMILYISGIAAGALVNQTALIIAAIVSLLTYVYSARLKRTSFWGNLLVALLTSSAFIYGGVAVGRVRESLIPAIFSFFFHFGREVLKDIEDMEGDAESGIKTFPLKYGIEPSLKLAGFSFGLLIILTFLPFLYEIYNLIYFIVVLLGVDLVLVYTMISARRDSGSANLKRLNTLLKIDMLVGLFSMYLGIA